MSSGIDITEEGLHCYQDMKIAGKGKNRCIIYKISDDKKNIVVDKVVAKDPSKDQETEYNEIIRDLPSDQGRYIVWDLEVRNAKSGEKVYRLLFMSWCPDTAPVGPKMVFASSKESLKKKLLGIQTAVDCSDFSDLDYKGVVGKAGH